jgi:hypothetical protein
MKRSFCLIIILLGLINYAVCQKNKEKTSGKVILEIPKDKKGELVREYKTITAYTTLLNLVSLEPGYDSLQLRIWCNYGLLKKSHMVLISNQNGKWQGKLFTLRIDIRSDTLYYLEDRKEKNIEITASQWMELIKKMNILKIPSLKSSEYLPKYRSGVDTDYYMVEVATKNKYRFYDYEDPMGESKNFKEAENLEKFLTILEKEFGFKRTTIR